LQFIFARNTQNSMTALVKLYERLKFFSYCVWNFGALQQPEFGTKCNDICSNVQKSSGQMSSGLLSSRHMYLQENIFRENTFAGKCIPRLVCQTNVLKPVFFFLNNVFLRGRGKSPSHNPLTSKGQVLVVILTASSPAIPPSLAARI
jgi:hypothetical protein